MMPTNTNNILNRLSSLINISSTDSQGHQPKQCPRSAIKQQLYTFSQFMSQQIIKLSVYYQTKLQYQAGDYEEEIGVMKQEIQRQYRVIELMKQELEELVVLVNERNERGMGGKGEERNGRGKQGEDRGNSDDRINDTHNQQNRIKKYQQSNYPTTKTHKQQLYQLPSISGLQTITEEQTERTLMSNCEEEQGEGEYYCEKDFVYEGQKEDRVGVFGWEGGEEGEERQGQVRDGKCDNGEFMLIEDESQETQGQCAKGNYQTQPLFNQCNGSQYFSHHPQPHYNHQPIQPQPQPQPMLPTFNQPTPTQPLQTRPQPKPPIYFISSNKKPSNQFAQKQQSSSYTDPLEQQFIQQGYQTHQSNQSSQQKEQYQLDQDKKIIPNHSQQLNINNPNHKSKSQKQPKPKPANVMDFLEQIALGDPTTKPIKPLNSFKPSNLLKKLPIQQKKPSKAFQNPHQHSIPRSSSRSKSKQSHPSTNKRQPKHQTQQFDQSQNNDSSSRISRIRYTTDNFYSLADGQSISQKDRFFMEMLERQHHVDVRSLQATFGKNSREKNALQEVVMSCTNRVVDRHDNQTQKPTTQSRKSSLKEISLKQANPQKKPHNNNKQNIPYRKSSDTTCQKNAMLKKPTSNKYLASKNSLNPAISNEQSIHNLLQSHLESTNKFLVGQKKQQLKYDGDRLTINNQSIRHGHGVLFYSNGLIYQGEFQNNKRQGYGLLKFNHVQLYSGDWVNDELHGTGKIRNCAIINKKKKQLTSESHNSGNISDQAFYQSMFLKWISYCGQFKHNRFDGQGTLYLQGGEKFIGFFKNGTAQGQGALYRKNGQVENGRWKNNVLVQRLESIWQ